MIQDWSSCGNEIKMLNKFKELLESVWLLESLLWPQKLSSLIFKKPFLFPCCLVLGPNFWPISCPFLEYDNSFLFIFSPDYV